MRSLIRILAIGYLGIILIAVLVNPSGHQVPDFKIGGIVAQSDAIESISMTKLTGQWLIQIKKKGLQIPVTKLVSDEVMK